MLKKGLFCDIYIVFLCVTKISVECVAIYLISKLHQLSENCLYISKKKEDLTWLCGWLYAGKTALTDCIICEKV